ncbi:transmembrane protein 165-like [Cimex lectularius]|uniref:GDT1 family protein n=1 Tax=Cimex lectularius TaxID=79782 RepID=A0A8I6THH2_CIMLE|nr:transmembrane protein 165-like [Cimex lectularius]
MAFFSFLLVAPLLFSLVLTETEPVFRESFDPDAGPALDATTHVKDSVEEVRKLEGQWIFLQGFATAFSMIILSEIGDKTFFIAAVLAMKYARLIIFIGAISALALMTILSVAFGWVAAIVPRVYTHYISAALFAIFGLKMIRDGWKMSSNRAKEDLEAIQTRLQKKQEKLEGTDKKREVELSSVLMLGKGLKKSDSSVPDEENIKVSTDINTVDEETMEPVEKKPKHKTMFLVPQVILQAFTLTFLAEWGDRSQLSTVILASRENMYAVTLGAILGHSICTGVAVVGGRMLAQKISTKTVMLIGGIVFLIFAISTLILDPTFAEK